MFTTLMIMLKGTFQILLLIAVCKMILNVLLKGRLTNKMQKMSNPRAYYTYKVYKMKLREKRYKECKAVTSYSIKQLVSLIGFFKLKIEEHHSRKTMYDLPVWTDSEYFLSKVKKCQKKNEEGEAMLWTDFTCHEEESMIGTAGNEIVDDTSWVMVRDTTCFAEESLIGAEEKEPVKVEFYPHENSVDDIFRNGYHVGLNLYESI